MALIEFENKPSTKTPINKDNLNFDVKTLEKVADKTKGIIQVYEITDFAAAVHQGNALYLDGRYEESEKTWAYINKMNTAFKFSYEALGKAAFKRQDYQEAMDYYMMAENVTGYSQAFWYSRNDW